MPSTSRIAWLSPLRLLLAASLAVASLIHLVLIPDHFAESTLMGLGFVGAASAQFGAAALVVLRPRPLLYAAIIAMSLNLIALYAYNVMIGLPWAGAAVAGEPGPPVEATHSPDEPASSEDPHAGHDPAAEADGHGEHHDGLVLGAGEAVDAGGAATKTAEMASIVLAALLLARTRVDRPASRKVGRPSSSP